MKPSAHRILLIILVSLLPACSPATAATPAQPISPTGQPTAELPYYPLDTLTNIQEIDVIIKAVASGDAQELRDLFDYTETVCMTVNALGGPPPCRENEAEGTPVEVLPSLGAEGSFLRKDEVENFPGLHVKGLYAIYRIPDSVFSDPNYPAGDYAIVYMSEENIPDVVLQVTDGKIVRIDYGFGYPTQTIPEDVTDFILEPVLK